jgi:hypothetical protein
MLSIGLVLTLVSVAMAVDMPGFTNSTQCVFVPGTKTFSCQFGTTSVGCSAVTNFTVFGDVNYYVFGIETLGTGFTNMPVTGFFYNLYPRSFDNTTYLGTTFGGHKVVLYYGPNFVEYGIRVFDSDCFGRLVKLFGTVTDFHPITVGTTTVNLIGEVLVNDPVVVAKRWLYGYGFGYGYPYYGWGGWGGYGLGYYGGYWGRK